MQLHKGMVHKFITLYKSYTEEGPKIIFKKPYLCEFTNSFTFFSFCFNEFRKFAQDYSTV